MSERSTATTSTGSPDGDGGRLEVLGRLDADRIAAVTALCSAATEADEVPPLSEHVTLHLRHGGEGPDLNLLLWDGEELAGYAHLDPTDEVAGAAAEIVVHPAHRRHGYGRAMVAAALDRAPAGRLRLWAHGDVPGARELAADLGFAEVRRLEQWRRSLRSPIPDAPLPAGVSIRSFRPGEDDQAWLALNARAFADHPEQGSWTQADLSARMRESWFDPSGFLIAEQDEPREQDERDDGGRPRMVAFHWTKVHGHGHGHDHEPIGEVYVVGVDPDRQGGGLGRAMTVAGLRRLRAQGLAQAMLYVEADNAAARAVYRSLGFTPWDTDVMFHRSR